MKRLVAAGLLALAVASSAGAHGPVGGGVGYVSSIAGLEPDVFGVVVRVLGGDDRLQLVNYSGKTIVVDGYAGEPFLRFTAKGVEENVRSPAAYLSRERDPERAHVPASADAKAAPVWRKVTLGPSFAWHDHRIHWLDAEKPAVVRDAPKETHLIFRWKVPATADGKRFAIKGFLGYAPTAAELEDGGGRNWWAIGALAAAGALALVGVGAGARRV
jgi:hypothetical protein